MKLSIGSPLPRYPEIRSMCILFQVSSTIVYRIDGNEGNKILYAIDMQKTPIACIPDYSIDKTTVADVSALTRLAQDSVHFTYAERQGG